MGRGALVFKGDSKKKSQKRPHSVKTSTASSSHVTIRPLQKEEDAHVDANKESPSSLPAPPPPIIPGTGTIVVSGTVVTSVGAPFPADLQAGDALLIQDELRVVTIKVSDHCLNLSSALTKSTSSTTEGGGGGMEYSYICKPKAPTKKEAPDGDPASEPLLLPPTTIYRERTEHGNYRFKSGPAAGDRSAALAWRSKKTSDKYC